MQTTSKLLSPKGKASASAFKYFTFFVLSQRLATSRLSSERSTPVTSWPFSESKFDKKPAPQAISKTFADFSNFETTQGFLHLASALSNATGSSLAVYQRSPN